MTKNAFGLYLAVLLSLVWATPTLAGVQARVQPNPVLAGEVFQLEITQSPAGDEEPQLLPLPPGVRELQRQSGQSTQIINGRTSTSRRWVITMVARTAGEHAIQIAPLDGESVAPISLSVRAPDPHAAQAPEAFSRFEANVTTTWEGAEFALNLRVYVAGELESGSLPDPSAPGLVLEKLWEDNDSEELIGNTRYRVLQRQYVGFAESAGTLTIPGPIFSGNVVDRSRRARFPGFSVPTRQVTSVADDLVLTIRPAETRTDAAWLPAQSVSFSDEVLPPAGGAESGQAIKRTIRVRIDGQLHTQLPDFQWPLPDRNAIQSFAEEPNSSTQAQNGGVQALVEQTFVHIPRNAGVVLLPAIRLPWFNTGTGEWEEATLPARQLQVSAAAGRTTGDLTPEPSLEGTATAKKSDPADFTANIDAAPPADVNLQRETRESPIWKITAAISTVGWALTLLALLVTRLRRRPEDGTTDASAHNSAEQELSLRQACKQIREDHPAEAESAVLAWARHVGLIDSGSGLLQLARATEDSPLADSLRKLSAARYGQGTWSAEELKTALRSYRPDAESPAVAGREALPPLYPR